MTFDQFLKSVGQDSEPPETLPLPLRALWFDGKNDWPSAHQCAQAVPGWEGAWVHAYLHRKEGDLSNARYWYRRAGKSEFKGDLQAEWEEIVQTLLKTEPRA